ncbi:hypothetical protein DY000_02009004 [Brassica cretica]|uniref:Metallo-beta-lactamase domain-containing protein n=1 Tax=Brassica cretica TaxID=69181 RepID=A0ABQ7BSE4_BRACR|nr:hypothetical protein DY000_02009004 [Brassica cretica]
MMEDGSSPAENGSDRDGSALIFLGTGCSSAVPNAMCLIQKSDSPCHVCSQSLSIPPERNPNYRGNTSLLVDYCQSDGNHKYIQIDVGKTFREQVLRWFTLHSIPQVDSKKLKEGQEVRRVAQLDWRVIEEDCEKPFVASGLSFTPLPVMHGEDYVCLGFLFGEKSRVAYISDVSRFLPSTEYVISKSGGGQLDLLILDTLYKTGSHNTHLCFPQTLETIKRLSPKRALLIGMTHEFDHHKDNEFLEEWSKREGISVKLAHDGLRVPIDL